MNYEESLAYLDKLAVFGVRLGLGRIEKLLAKIDNPHTRYRTVHVTGSNGKGSVSVMLANVIRTSGLHVGLYTSPHLNSYTERIAVDGQPILEQEFADCLSAISVYVEEMLKEGEECPTQFEVLTAVAFLYFAMKNVDYAVIEVGLGGLLDSTNVITPEVAVITNVTLEHADKCGGTLEGVAKHKAGIIKEGVPVVTAAKGEPLEIIKSVAAEKNADVFIAGRDFSSQLISVGNQMQKLCFTSELTGRRSEEYELHLLGLHQVENSAVALMTAELLHNEDDRIDVDTIPDGLKLSEWPARFEIIDGENFRAIVDGAHNPAGIEVLRQSLDTYFPIEERVFLLGILRDKDMPAMVEKLLRPTDTAVFTVPDSPRKATVEEEMRLAMPLCAHVEGFEDRGEALERAIELSHDGKLLIVAGSLYLVGEIRSRLLDLRR